MQGRKNSAEILKDGGKWDELGVKKEVQNLSIPKNLVSLKNYFLILPTLLFFK